MDKAGNIQGSLAEVHMDALIKDNQARTRCATLISYDLRVKL